MSGARSAETNCHLPAEMSVSDIREQMLPAKSRKAIRSITSVALSSLRAKVRESERIAVQKDKVLHSACVAESGLVLLHHILCELDVAARVCQGCRAYAW